MESSPFSDELVSVSDSLELACCTRLGECDMVLSEESLVVDGSGERLLRINCEVVDLEAGDEIFNSVCAACSSVATSLPLPSTCCSCCTLPESGSLMLTPLTGGTGGV